MISRELWQGHERERRVERKGKNFLLTGSTSVCVSESGGDAREGEKCDQRNERERKKKKKKEKKRREAERILAGY